MEVPSMLVRLSAIDLRYGDTQALSGVSLDVQRGSVVGLVGRNGAGKSTLINLLCGLVEADRGQVELFGQTRGPDDASVMRTTGWLLAEPALFQYLTAEETLTYLADLYRLREPAATERVRDLIRFFELGDFDGRLADELSTGTVKRLAIAAAMIHAPRLLVLDEPFESLDPLMVRRLRRALRTYANRGGTILLSSHLLDVVQEICDHVYILEEGRIVFDGPGAQFRSRDSSSVEGTALEATYAALVERTAEHELHWL
jgi:ABC-2 type transport system ATP-binding protein